MATFIVVGALAHACQPRATETPAPYASVDPAPSPDPVVALLRADLGRDVDRSCTITSWPAGAEVRVVEPGGRAYTLGVTPLTRSGAWGTPRDVVSIELPGYKRVLVDLAGRGACDRDVELVPIESPSR